MKIKEILLETTNDDIILLKIAKEAMPAIRKAYYHFIENDIIPDTDHSVNLGTIQELTGLHGKGVYKQLLNTPIYLSYEYDELDVLSPPYRGKYEIEKENKPIFLNCYPFDGEHDFTEVMSTFIHEMRHVLDDYMSNGEFYQSDKRKARKSRTFGHNDYLQQKSEINARYTQAIKDIEEHLTPELSTNEIKKLIKTTFEKHQISGNTRSMNRAYQFIISNKEFPDNIRYHSYPENNNESK